LKKKLPGDCVFGYNTNTTPIFTAFGESTPSFNEFGKNAFPFVFGQNSTKENNRNDGNSDPSADININNNSNW